MMRSSPPSADPGYLLEIQPSGSGVLSISVRGAVDFSSVEARERDLASAIAAHADTRTVRVDASGVEAGDSALAMLLLRMRDDASRKGRTIEVARVDDVTRSLLSLIDPERALRRPPPSGPLLHPLEVVGAYLTDRLAELADMVQFIGRVTLTMLWSLRRPWRVRWGEVLSLVQRAGTDALPIVLLLSLLVGLVTAFSGAIQLRQFGANIFIANLVGIGMTREMGPLLAAILLTGRSGSAFAAEIGTMKISDEVDALTVMGIDPLDYLVTPRILAVMLALPLLALFADAAGIIGGMAIAVLTLDLTPLAFAQQLQKAIGLWDLFSGVLKAFVFGILVAGVGCYRGMATSGGALGVGRSTTSAVVNGIFLIVVADSIFVIVFHYLGL